jgi:hypothetical protein
MSSIRAVKNQYRGINAHLHSYWQAKGGWNEFHTSHIADLHKALRTVLLPMGYTAGIEQSLQIHPIEEPVRNPKSDVTIYDPDAERAHQPVSSTGIKAPVVTPIPDLLEDMEEIDEYRALAIYQPEGQERGYPVAWIELLSPSNKPGGQDAKYYRIKRWRLIQTGIVFVEIDYLHESASTIPRNPVYRNGDDSPPGAHPYRIVVIDPRPVYPKGNVYQFPFNVDETIPPVSIPLSGSEVLEDFEFGVPYNRTIEESLFAYELVDYDLPPLNMDRYSKDDQRHILARMFTIRAAVANGVDLDASAPLPLANMGPDDPVGRIGWKGE